MKYKGTYRLKANIDKNTNDYPRDENGNLDTDDIFIKCMYGNQIYHYGRSILVAYIPSIGRGHNILRGIAREILNIEEKLPYETLYQLLEKDKTIYDIMENDEEIEFKFNAKHIGLIAKYLKPQTSGSGISPFSSKNLPKVKYNAISDVQIREYKDITDLVGKDNLLLISQITSRFLTDILANKKAYKSKNIKSDMKAKMLKGKDYIHFEGYWDEYIEYLKKNIMECEYGNRKNI